MLARDRFQTATPNVVDPGDDTPALPTRGLPNQGPDDNNSSNNNDDDDSDNSSSSSSNNTDNSSINSNTDNSNNNSDDAGEQTNLDPNRSPVDSRLYTRNGNKGAISKGIKLRCIESDDDGDESSDDSGEEDEEVVVVFEKSSSHSNISNENRSRSRSRSRSPSNSTDTFSSGDLDFIDDMFEDDFTQRKKNYKKKRRERRRNEAAPRISLDMEEDETGVSQARLFAAAIINETERRRPSFRNIMNWDGYDRNSFVRGGTRTEPVSTLRSMLQRATSFRNTNATERRPSLGYTNHEHTASFRRNSLSLSGNDERRNGFRRNSLGFGNDDRRNGFRRNSLGLGNDDRRNTPRRSSLGFGNDERRNSLRNINALDEKHLENIWLVEDDEDIVGEPAESNPIPKQRTWVAMMLLLLVAILLITGFSVPASSSRSSLRSSSKSSAGNVHTHLAAEALVARDPRLAEIVSYLSDADISSTRNLYDASSPQFKAARWMAEEDFEKLPLPNSVSGDSLHQGVVTSTTSSGGAAQTIPFNFVQRYVLAVVYFAMGGDKWDEKYYFASTDRHECSWYKQILPPGTENSRDDRNSDRATKDSTYKELGVVCDRELQVRGISLPDNNLKGTIPSEIQHLTNLQWLELNGNHLTGTIPEDMRELSHLLELDLSDNSLSGQMVPFFWLGERLAKLQKLDLSNNQLTRLPSFDEDSNANHAATRREPIGGEKTLMQLALGGNDGSRTNNNNIMDKEQKDIFVSSADIIVIPEEFRYLTSLRELTLDNMGLNGTLPVWLFHELPELRVLDLSRNNMTGTIVDGFRVVDDNDDALPLQHLEALVLHDNSFTGTLPEFVGLLPKLKTLSVHHTNLTVGPNAADFICWRREGSFETLATDCGDTSCPCCMENCCASDDCYADVDWDNIYNRASLVPRTKEGEDHD
eukprot:CAMPEP_0172356380 /NCGR_PEP_ID=MMETSP1060-20121228/718_1 /TAXON_ID=37318 /ORGANISM="Pseudo-nitzschia pungens, Strain cf. cingulata" /LENGTH=926 /DNA_ID=CAMNT_0013076431 /DNA_START=270 /DNA_END=3050 /DNA_ORIENTATION=+